MLSGFWRDLPKPIFALAPMSNVTDAAFRRIIAKYGKPDIFWTEFVSCDGLMSRGREKLLLDLKFTPGERPIVAQIFGSKPENFYKTALLLQKLKFDGIDINLGCPDRAVEKQGAGAKLMLNTKLAQEIIKETKRGAGKLPISIKTRLGYNKDILEEWLPALLETEPAAITIHCRTRKEMSKVPARWERIADAVKIRDQYQSKGTACRAPTLILGNGDVASTADGYEKIKQTGCDGVMIGRAIFGNPWLFKNYHPTIQERLKVMVEHTKLFEKLFKNKKSFNIMKKHFKAYVNGFDGAKELRIKLMATKNAAEVARLIKQSNLCNPTKSA